MPGAREVTAFRRDVHPDGRPLTQADREQLIKPYLPTPPRARSPSPSLERSYNGASTSRPRKPQSWKLRRPHGLRRWLLTLIHRLLFWIIQFTYSFYIRGRQIYHAVIDRVFSVLYYHHRTPELIRRDIEKLSRLPKHLSVIVDLAGNHGRRNEAEGLSKLIEDAAEIAAWCTCASIPMLSIYERTGILKSHIPSLHRALTHNLRSYYPPASLPAIQIRAPHHPAYSPPSTPPRASATASPNNDCTSSSPPSPLCPPPTSLNVLLLSATDGRPTLVDLTKTLTEMSQHGKLHPSDISADLIDAEITESSCGEPDLLVLMAASAYKRRRPAKRRRRRPSSTELGRGADDVGGDAGSGSAGAGGDVCLRGYPPWQVRLTEIFHVQDNSGAGYQVFLRALHKYAKSEMRLGR